MTCSMYLLIIRNILIPSTENCRPVNYKVDDPKKTEKINAFNCDHFDHYNFFFF